MGALQTFGKMQSGYSADNLMDAQLIFMMCSNWSYSVDRESAFVHSLATGVDFVE